MLADRMKGFSGSQTSGMRNRARKLSAEGIKVVNFAAGELDQDTSQSIKSAARNSIDSRKNQYTDTMGIAALREKLAARVSQKTGAEYKPDEVGFTGGAKQALFNANFVLFQPGDEVIIPAPYWVTFPEQVRLAGATPVFVDTVHNDFQLDMTLLERAITPKTKGIILNTPHNPTGVVYSAESLKQIANLAIKHNFLCIFDECYDELVYNPVQHMNIVGLVPEMKSRTVLIGSFSKTYCISGWRAGFVAAPAPVIKAITNLQSHIASNPSNIVQYAALAALDSENDAFVVRIRQQLTEQRQLAIEWIQKMKQLSCVIPSGAFYLFPDVSALLQKSHLCQKIENVDQLAEMLLERAHIAVVPGSAFGSDRHVRISYSIPKEDIACGLASLKAFVDALV